MAQEKTARQKAEERAALQDTQFNSAKEAGVGAIRSLDNEYIPFGVTFTVPKDYKIFKSSINGNSFTYLISVEGYRIPLGIFTRVAKALVSGKNAKGEVIAENEVVKPTGTVIKEMLKHSNMDEFLATIAEKPIDLQLEAEVTVKNRYGEGDTAVIKVPHMDYAA